ncbi:RNA-directed DNA polymerase (Reverse transcriptase), partial [Trifolium medium]|nr:RNA-directed DNA polymerase (Reverse transcriptase) [Trifolium medium]
MQVSWLPQSICDLIDQTVRNFIWKGANNSGIHLVSWQKVAQPKASGGLGIRMARDANIALLGSSILYHTNTTGSSNTWSSIIKAKNYLKDGFSWRAGSGNSSFWFSHWIPQGAIGSLVHVVDIHDIELKINDVYTSSTPDLSILYTELPPQ